MAALPVIQQIEQGLATRVANGVSAFFAPTDSGSPGQNVPSQAASSSANSAQSPSASSLSNSVTSALLQLQNASGLGQVHGHHHHGAGKYKAASDALSQLTDTSGSASSASSATSAVTA
jgi:hypothetical protein